MSKLIDNIYKEVYNKNPSELLDDLKRTAMYVIYDGPWIRLVERHENEIESSETAQDLIKKVYNFAETSRYYRENRNIAYYPLIERKIYNSFKLKYHQAKEIDNSTDSKSFNGRFTAFKSSIDSNIINGYLALQEVTKALESSKSQTVKINKKSITLDDFIMGVWAGMHVEMVPVSTFKQAHGEEFTLDAEERKKAMFLIQMSKSRIKSGVSGASDIYKVHNIYRENIKGDTTNGKGSTVNEMTALIKKDGSVSVASGVADAIKRDNRAVDVNNK